MISKITDTQQTGDEGLALPFSTKKQDAVLGHLIYDQKFFMLARNQVQVAWFVDPHAGKVWKYKLDFFSKYNRPPTEDELKYGSDIQFESQQMRDKLIAKINAAKAACSDFGLDVISRDLTQWLKARIFFEGANKAKTAFNQQSFDKTYAIQEETTAKLKQANFYVDYEVGFSDWRKDFEESQVEKSQALTFGFGVVDDLLLPNNEKRGSLLPGDTTIILAPVNTGKTTSMITTIVANIKRGKSVLFIPHEGRERDIKNKLWCCFLGVDEVGLWALQNTPEGQYKLNEAAAYFERFLTFSPYCKAGLTVEDMEPIIRRKQDDRAARYGKGYDMLAVDYPALLGTKLAAGGHLNKRTMDEIVYGYYVTYALEFRLHSLLAIQTNREGSKINKGIGEHRRLLTMEDVHESFGPMQKATNVMTLNRSPRDKAMNRLIYYIDKSRSSETGFAVVCNSRFQHAITHSDDLGGVWYRGTDNKAEEIDVLLQNPQNKGKEVQVTDGNL